ncbi:MAG TPA: SusC/RagA family TonB-linked outer membrane protein [Chitinophagaceae bacterium]|nr:SusC/RagA family TonB-linked outer membrane protein [Chitinophagaceae bacterium]
MRKLLLLLGVVLLCVQLTAQQRIITGKITDDKGNPIPNASIIVKGSSSGTVSQSDGTFTMKLTKGTMLVVSSLGFEATTIPIQDKLTVSMKTDPNALSEVVVTGVGVATSRKKLGISVETITADKLPAAPTASISQALIGKVAGAQISSTDGTPGAKVNILLRGINTLSRGTQPMVLVDGLEIKATDLGSLDLNSVERVEVVEGAASSTIYGAQGANGVIQIFTRKGKIGQTSINFSSSYGSSTYINSGNLHQAYTHGYKTDANNNIVDAAGNIMNIKPDGTYAAGVNINGVNQGSLVYANTSPLTDDSKAYTGNFKFYDHFKQLFQSAGTFNNSLNITSGAGKTDFSLTLSNSYQESIYKDNGALKRTNLSINVGTEVFKGFKIRSITQMIYQKNDFNPYFTAGPNALYQAENASPFFDFDWKDAQGNYANRLNATPVSVNGANPNYYKQYSFGSDETIDIIQGIQASYRVNRFLDIESKYGLNYEKEQTNYVYKNQSLNINAVSNSSFIGGFSSNAGGVSNVLYNTTFTNFLNTANLHFDFQKDFNSKLPIVSTTLAGYDYRKNVAKQYTTTGDGFQLYPIYNVTQTNTKNVSVDIVTPFITFGTFVNEALTYGNIAGIAGGFRSDYSSAFGRGNKPFTFYNANGFIRISQLNFWNRLSSVLPEFKIRGGYGEAGIQPSPFARYITLSTRSIGNVLSFYTPNVQSNPDLKVEISKETEIGADLTFKLSKGRWLNNGTISATVWKRTSDDNIYPVDAPPSSGGGGLLTNSFSLESHGVTIALNLNVVSSKNFSWDMTTNFNTQTSKIAAVTTGQPIIVTSSAGYGNYVLQAGSRIGQLYGLKTFRSVEQTKQDGTPYIAKADYGKYQLVNGNLVDTATKGIMFTNENYAFGDPNPKFNMAFINNFNYKGLTLSVQFDWVYGSHLYNQSKEWMYRDGIHGDWGEKITINGQTGAWANYYTSAYADQFGSINGARNSIKDYFYEGASFLRLRNLSLSYDFLNLVKIKYVKKLQLVLTGRNLWTVTNYTGFDPEISSGTVNSAFDRGVDYVSTPNTKTYQVGINVGF